MSAWHFSRLQGAFLQVIRLYNNMLTTGPRLALLSELKRDLGGVIAGSLLEVSDGDAARRGPRGLGGLR